MEAEKEDDVIVSQFASQTASAEDLLKSQTVGLLHLADFRKRRAEALEQKDRETQGIPLSRLGTPVSSGTVTPREGSVTPQSFKKQKKPSTKGKLSFGLDDEEEDSRHPSRKFPSSPGPIAGHTDVNNGQADNRDAETPAVRKGPNASLSHTPKVLTKSSMLKEAQVREQLRKEFMAMQERVKLTEILIPFVFYDGTSVPGGRCKIKKGDHIWLFLDQARKVGAELGVGNSDRNRREWARVGVDDLMFVRGDLILPHHYDFYYFLINKVCGHNGPLFDFSSEPTAATPAPFDGNATIAKDYNPLVRAGKKKEQTDSCATIALEGTSDEPSLTKVVDRRWYEKNKHIYPASLWTEYDPAKDYESEFRTDAQGNAFFFS